MKKSRRTVSLIRPDVNDAIRKSWPRGIIEPDLDEEESYLTGTLPGLRRELAALNPGGLFWERSGEGGPEWNEDSDPEEDPPDWDEPSRSYHLFFLSPPGKGFTHKSQIDDFGVDLGFDEEFDDDSEPGELGPDGGEHEPRIIQGEAQYGWSVGVSLVAPFAMVSPGALAVFEDGSQDPQPEMLIQLESGERVDPEDALTTKLGKEAMEVLHRLRTRIIALLESHSIQVLPKEELLKRVPRLRADEEILVERPITVRDAFFFEAM